MNPYIRKLSRKSLIKYLRYMRLDRKDIDLVLSMKYKDNGIVINLSNIDKLAITCIYIASHINKNDPEKYDEYDINIGEGFIGETAMKIAAYINNEDKRYTFYFNPLLS